MTKGATNGALQQPPDALLCNHTKWYSPEAARIALTEIFTIQT